MSAGKTLLRRAASAKIEATYNAGGSITYPTDAFHTTEDFEVEEQYQFDGQRSGTSAGSSMQRGEAKQGRYCDVTLSHRVRMTGAGVEPPTMTVDAMLRAHGMLKTVSHVGFDSATYTPITDGVFESIFGEFYVGGEKFTYQGGHVYKWVHTLDGVGLPVWAFSLKAPLQTRVADAALPVITAYPSSTGTTPKGAGSILTLAAAGGTGAFQGKAHRSTVTSERTIDEMMSQALETTDVASGHAGFQLGKYTQTIEVSVEGTALPAAYNTAATLDPKRCEEEGTLITVVHTFNPNTQYKRYKFASGATAQIKEAKKDRSGTIRLWNLTIVFPPSSDVADDGLSVVFN